jgi:hypothetical protein
MVAIHLQPRDIEMLSLLGDVGVLDTDLLHVRCFPEVTLRRCQQRLKQHAEQGLIRSQKLAVWYGDDSGRVPTLFTLTERGADVVAEATGLRPFRIHRNDPKPETFHHRLAIVKTRLALDDGFHSLRLHVPQWVMEQDRRPDASPNDPPSRQRLLYHAFPDGNRSITCQPDAACRMSIPRDAARSQAGMIDLIAYFEIDRSTERRGQVLSKLPGYSAAIEQRSWLRYFAEAASAPVRVFFVCHSQQRIDSLRASLGHHPLSPILRFATMQELKSRHPLTDAVWQDSNGLRREIVRLTSPLAQ